MSLSNHSISVERTIPMSVLKSLSVALTVLCLLGVGGAFAFAYPSLRDAPEMALYRDIGRSAWGSGDADARVSEYPPLASSVFAIVAHQPFVAPFRLAWALTLFLCVALASAYAAAFLRPSDAPAIPGATLASIVLLGPLLHVARFDLLVMLCLFLAWLAFAARRFLHAGFFVVIAGCLKLVPLAAVPLFLVLTPAGYRRATGLGMLIGLGVGILLPLLVLGPGVAWDNAVHVLGYHGSRGFQVESVWSGVDMLLRNLRGEVAVIDFRRGAYDNVSVPVPSALPLLCSGIGIALLLLWSWKARRVLQGDIAVSFFLCFLWLLSWSPVLSPQYFVWVVPLMLWWAARRLWTRKPSVWQDAAILCATVLLALATQWIYPSRYTLFLNQQDLLPTLLLNARNGLMFVLILLLLPRLRSREQAAR